MCQPRTVAMAVTPDPRLADYADTLKERGGLALTGPGNKGFLSLEALPSCRPWV